MIQSSWCDCCLTFVTALLPSHLRADCSCVVTGPMLSLTKCKCSTVEQHHCALNRWESLRPELLGKVIEHMSGSCRDIVQFKASLLPLRQVCSSWRLVVDSDVTRVAPTLALLDHAVMCRHFPGLACLDLSRYQANYEHIYTLLGKLNLRWEVVRLTSQPNHATAQNRQATLFQPSMHAYPAEYPQASSYKLISNVRCGCYCMQIFDSGEPLVLSVTLTHTTFVWADASKLSS